MPCFDMPLEELKTYTGSSPRPADFDEYWRRGMAEMESVYAPPELVRSDFPAKYSDCYDMYFTGVGGARIHSRIHLPKNITKPAPCVCFYHGYAGNAGDWWWHSYWAAQGYAYASIDCRGQSGTSKDVGGVKGTTLFGHIIRGLEDPNPDKLLYRSIYLDCVQMARCMMNMDCVDETQVYTTGVSQGGALSLVTAALEPKIAKVVTASPFLSDYKRAWEMDILPDGYPEIKDYFRHRDPTHETEKEVFDKLGYIDIQNHAPNVRAKVLMITSLMDDDCPVSTQFAMYNKLTCEKEVLIYPDFRHELFPGMSDAMFRFLVDK
ncbi:MAG: acetylxylan esterase [Abditibacteriota bacterium]|nr:acetylxylan esterase [Abditibacteriota bacterium]